MPPDTAFNPVATAVALVTAIASGDSDTYLAISRDLERPEALQVIAALTGMLEAHVRMLSALREITVDAALAGLGLEAADFDRRR